MLENARKKLGGFFGKKEKATHDTEKPLPKTELEIGIEKLRFAFQIAIGKDIFNAFPSKHRAILISTASKIIIGEPLQITDSESIYETAYAGAIVAIYGETGEIMDLDQAHNMLIGQGFTNTNLLSKKPMFYIDA